MPARRGRPLDAATLADPGRGQVEDVDPGEDRRGRRVDVQAELRAEGDGGRTLLRREGIDRDLVGLRLRQVDVGHRAVRTACDLVPGRTGRLAGVADQEVGPDRELRVHTALESPPGDPGRGGGGHGPATDLAAVLQHEGAVVHDVRAAGAGARTHDVHPGRRAPRGERERRPPVLHGPAGVHEGGGRFLVLPHRRAVDVEEDPPDRRPAPVVEPAAGLETLTEMQHAYETTLPAPAGPSGVATTHAERSGAGASHSTRAQFDASRACSSSTEIVSNVTGRRGEQPRSSLPLHGLWPYESITFATSSSCSAVSRFGSPICLAWW